MKPTVLVLLALAAATTVQAQTWNEDFLNQPVNIRYGSVNPTRISYNDVRNFAVADVDCNLNRGDFHAVDQSGKGHTIGAYIGGLRQIGRFDVQGRLSYRNRKDNDQSWNSTLWNNPYNPFVLCDSVPGDATTESYDMGVTATYAFNNRLKAALQADLRTGSRADQADPRPRTTTSILPITAGADYRLTDRWSIGASVGARFFNSQIEYTSVNSTLHSYRYFLMKGMGDYAKRMSGDEPGYKRDYKGTDVQATIDAVWQPDSGRWANFVEAAFAFKNEDATDGGASYNFNGGDYQETVVTAQDRLQWKSDARTMHNFTLIATLASGKGTWSDQKRELDLERGSAVFYRVLSKNTIQENQRLCAALHYQFDKFSQGRRDITVEARVALAAISRKQYLGTSTPKQKINYIDLQLQGTKTIHIKKVSLLAQVGGDYRLPITKDYANGSPYTGEDDISQPFTRRVFEYESCGRFGLHALADASMPVSSVLTAGLFVKCRYDRYTDKEETWQGYDGTHLTTASMGIYLKF